ncbi:lipopolysaccharide assembly protein LapA domain-containing protein [Glaciecola siphonariae]|uniref:Lipopolysaccharide assembly protein LapA domain-containing protein n=1 Tax=Glaciecola siphonariae TaxID=521012 RepID=A0ABV9LS96_9ALTE
MKAILVIIIVILLVLLAIVVGSRNAEIISVNYLLAQVDMRVSTFMVWSMSAGFIVGICTILTKYLALRVKVTLLTRKLNKLAKVDT